MFNSLFRKKKDAPAQSSMVPAGQRVYAVGDVHGRLDLLRRLIDEILADDRTRAPADTQIILLGDLVDRGPDSAGVIDYVRALMASGLRIRCLAGNHEEVMLTAIDAPSKEAARFFYKVGGRETLTSYGLDRGALEQLDWDGLAEAIPDIVPAAHIEFLRDLENMIVIGDYCFVHAGVNPALSLQQQQLKHLRWIREGFVDHDEKLEKTVVYGHTVTQDVNIGPSRIGIDTGAYKTGKLTALMLEGAERVFLDTADIPQAA